MRLATVIRNILRAEETMGSGIVESVQQNSAALVGRSEQVLVAGNYLPSRGDWTPWMQIKRGLLVTPWNLRYGMRPHIGGGIAPLWKAEIAEVASGVEGGWTYGEAVPACAEDPAGRAWVPVIAAPGFPYAAVTLHFYSAENDRLLDGWRSRANIEFAPLAYGVHGGPGSVACLVDDGGRLYAWWHRPNVWRQTKSTGGIMQSAQGDIDLQSGGLGVATADLELPYVQGFGPADWVDYLALAIDEDERLWLAASLKYDHAPCALQLLFGNELEEGWYGYSVHVDSGMAELGSSSWGFLKGTADPHIKTEDPARPSYPRFVEYLPGGSFHQGRNYFCVTAYIGAGNTPETETLGSQEVGIELPGDGLAVRMQVPPTLANGNLRVYHRGPGMGHFHLAYDFGDDEGGQITLTQPGTGRDLPEETTLAARAVRVSAIKSGPPGTGSRIIYRTKVQESREALRLPYPDIFHVGAVSGNTDDEEWDDHVPDGGLGGAARDQVVGQGFSALAVGRSGAARSLGSVQWETVLPWERNDYLGDRPAILGLRAGAAVVFYRDEAGKLAAKRLGAGGGELSLPGGPEAAVCQAAMVERQGQVLWRSFEWGDHEEWHWGRLDLRASRLALAESKSLGSWPWSDVSPGFTWSEWWGCGVVHGAGETEARIYNIVDAERIVQAGAPIGIGGLLNWGFAAPQKVWGRRVWGIFGNSWDKRVHVIVWRPLL
jgi:hypothetical protein